MVHQKVYTVIFHSAALCELFDWHSRLKDDEGKVVTNSENGTMTVDAPKDDQAVEGITICVTLFQPYSL